MAPRVTRRWVRVGNLRHHFRVAGPAGGVGAPLVLVHGVGVSGAYWARVQPLLAARRPVYAPDLPGFGHSAKPAAVLDSAGLAGAIRDWLDALSLARVHLLGHSLAAQVVAEFARAHPERVARLVLAAPTIGKRGPKLLRRTLDLLRDIPREDPTLLPVVCPAYLRAGPRRIWRTDLLTNDDDTVATVAALRRPLLIVRGSRDCVVDRAVVQQLLDAAPRACAVEIPGAAHGLHWSHPRALARVVNAFLDGEAPAE
ncbi:MAG: alpha/beta fold hydrolase, partial [Chloroflexota bacterium]|nr:alpha/beta fold hydrolase [Chloroflexota bacterium]